MVNSSGLGEGKSRIMELHPGLLYGRQGSKHSGYLPLLNQPELEPAPVRYIGFITASPAVP